MQKFACAAEISTKVTEGYTFTLTLFLAISRSNAREPRNRLFSVNSVRYWKTSYMFSII